MTKTKRRWQAPVVRHTIHYEPEDWGGGHIYQQASDIAGSLLHHDSEAPWLPDDFDIHRFNNGTRRNIEWVPADHPINARLTLDDGVNSGRSAKWVTWTAADGRTFPMFVAELVKLVRSCGVEKGGVIEGDFQIVKRGSNFGIEYLGQ